MAEEGLVEWGADLPASDDGLVDPSAGKPVLWIEGKGWSGGPAVNLDQRFPLVAVVPVTAAPGEGALYPERTPGGSGLAKTSYALTDQVRSVDKQRIRKVFGAVTGGELAAIDLGLELFLGLGKR